MSLPVANVNDDPTGIVTITGTSAQGETLQTDASGLADPDGLGTFDYTWLRDGVPIPGATGPTYSLTQADVGAQLSVEVSYTDGGGAAETVTSATTPAVVNVNDAPTGSVLITGTAAQGETLQADASGLADADGLGQFSHAWIRDGTPIAGATNPSYTLTQDDVGAQISVEVAYTDGGGTSESVLSAPTASVSDENDAPTGQVAISGTTAQGGTLGADTSAVADPDGLGTFTYSWQRDSAPISGATSNTYQLTQADVGAQISVVVSWTDGVGTQETLTSAQTAPVENVNDAPTGDVLVIGTPIEGETLTADATGVADADGLGVLAYAWFRDGAPIAGASGSTYTLGRDDVGAQISAQVAYTDGEGTSEAITSAGTVAVSGAGQLVVGTPGPDDLAGTLGADTIEAAASDDIVTGGPGDDVLDGGEGEDTATYSGDRSSYTVTLSASGISVADRRTDGDGTDQLTNIGTLDFLDQDWPLAIFADVASLSEDAFREFVEVYIAYFNRAPDAEGLFFYGTVFANGTSLEASAATFLNSAEYAATYPPGSSNLEFATAVYSNVLGRVPDQLGLDFWVGVLDSGAKTRDVFILEVLKGAKAPPPPDATQDFIDQKAADVAYLSNKTDLGIYFAVTKGMSDVGNATAAMQLFDDGEPSDIVAAVAAVDGFYADALDPTDGEFLLPLVGVVDDPFAAI